MSLSIVLYLSLFCYWILLVWYECFQPAPLIATLSPLVLARDISWHVAWLHVSSQPWVTCTVLYCTALYCTVLCCTCPVSRETRGTRQNIRSLTLTVAAPESVTWLLGTYQTSIWCFWRDNWFKSWLKCCKLYLSTEETHTYLDI